MYRKVSGKPVTHPQRSLRRMRALCRHDSKLRPYGTTLPDLSDAIAELESSIRAPQGGRRHGGINKSRSR